MTTPLTRAELAAVLPDTLGSYLRARGWHLSDDVPHGEIWEPSSGDGWIFLPQEPDLADYANRVADVVRMLAEHEDRPQALVLAAIRSDAHNIGFRLLPDTPSGTIPVPDGMEAHEGLRNAVNSAIYDAITEEWRPVQPSHKPQEVYEYARKALLVAAAPGSYLLSVRIPAHMGERSRNASLFDLGEEEPSDPLGQRVSVVLYRGVAAAARAARTVIAGGRMDAFAAADSGVSANLCESLYQLGARGRMGFHVSVDLAGGAPSLGEPIVIDRAMVGVFAEGAQLVRRRFLELETTISGLVVALGKRRELQEYEVTVDGRVAGERFAPTRHFALRLTARQHDEAMRAYQTGQLISATGTLQPRDRTPRLVDVREFVIVESHG